MIYYVHNKENKKKADLAAGRGEGEKMKKRIAKKFARNFLATKKPLFGIYEEECCTYTDGRPGVWQTWAKAPSKVGREIYRQATKQGWDGCHWDDPLILMQDDSALHEWEEEWGYK